MEPLRIAICEDDQKDMESLTGIIAESGVPAKVYTYADGNGLLSVFTPGFFQLVFLDIYFDSGGDTSGTEENDGRAGSAPQVRKTKPPADNANGMDIALKIREADAGVWLAFITVSPDHAVSGYKAEAKRYFNKPPDINEVKELIQRAAEHFGGTRDEICVTIDRKRRSLRMRDIQYIEACNKKCIIHTETGILSSSVTLDGLSRLLTAPVFLRCHRSYIVNMDYILSAGRDFTMINGDKVYIGHLHQWRVRNDYRKHLLRLAKEL